MEAKLLFLGIVAIVFFMSAMAFHRYDLNRPIEIIFFGLTATLVLYFQYLLHQ